MASYDSSDRQFEVVRLMALKEEAEGQGRWDDALEINRYMAGRIGSSPAVAAIYRGQGVTADQLKTDAVMITTRRDSAVGTPIRYYGERGR